MTMDISTVRCSQNHSVLPEDQCTRVYIQGLSESNDPQILHPIRHAPPSRRRPFPIAVGTSRARRLSARRFDGCDLQWKVAGFSQQQVELPIAAGFSRTNALHFYPGGSAGAPQDFG